MFGPLQSRELDSFNMANTLLKNPVTSPFSNKSFGEVLEEKVQEVKQKINDKAADITEDSKATKKKKTKENNHEELIDVNKIIQNKDYRTTERTQDIYSMLAKYKDNKQFQDDILNKNQRNQILNPAQNYMGPAMYQPVYDQSPKKGPTKSQILAAWDKYAPTVTEDITKRAVRIDIPLLNDVQALVLRMNPDRSLSAAILGSEAMAELIKQNKDKLDRNLRHHHLSLKEFNTYRSELEFTSESGTKKKKKQHKSIRKVESNLF